MPGMSTALNRVNKARLTLNRAHNQLVSIIQTDVPDPKLKEAAAILRRTVPIIVALGKTLPEQAKLPENQADYQGPRQDWRGKPIENKPRRSADIKTADPKALASSLYGVRNLIREAEGDLSRIPSDLGPFAGTGRTMAFTPIYNYLEKMRALLEKAMERVSSVADGFSQINRANERGRTLDALYKNKNKIVQQSMKIETTIDNLVQSLESLAADQGLPQSVRGEASQLRTSLRQASNHAFGVRAVLLREIKDMEGR